MIRIRARWGRRADARKIRDNRAVDDASPDLGPTTSRGLRFPFAAGAGRVALALVRHEGAAAAGFAPHVDLFLAREEDADFARGADRNARCARTFRIPLGAVAARPDAPPLIAGSYDAVEIEPHRTEYLALDGRRELSGGRGVVTPVASGVGIAQVAESGAVEVDWPAFARRLRIDGTGERSCRLVVEVAEVVRVAEFAEFVVARREDGHQDSDNEAHQGTGSSGAERRGEGSRSRSRSTQEETRP
jgi:hypothetical protein